MNKSEFLLSKLSTEITHARSTELISFITSGFIGLASLFLALATTLPASYIGPFRFLLFISTVITVVFLFWILRRFIRNRRTKLDLLRKWERQIFLAKEVVDSLEGDKACRMIELIQRIEDSDISRNPPFGQFDNEFMSIVGK